MTNLIGLIKNGDDKIIKLLIEKGENINEKDSYGNSLLYNCIIYKSNIEIVKLLIEKGANINEIDSFGNSLLYNAIIENSNIEIIDLLIEKGADINEKDKKYKNSLLYNAIKHNSNIEIVKLLIKKGANIKEKDRYGNSLLYNAIKHKSNIEIVKLLIKKGADINEIDSYGNSLLYNAIITNNVKIVDLLIKKVKMNKKDKESFTDLVVKIIENNIEIEKLIEIVKLIEKVADINEKDSFGNTYLHYAIKHNSNIEIVKLLIEKFADINEIDRYGNSLLFYAIIKSNIEIVKLLIEKGANINEIDSFGNSLLYNAIIENSNIEIIDLLIEKGADINEKDRYGNSLLYNAIKHNSNIEIIDLLIEKVADINEIDSFGNTYLHYAIIYKSNIEIVKLLIEKGVNINKKNNNGDTAYTLEKNEEIKKILIKNGAKVDKLLYLVHGTKFENLKAILNTGYIHTVIDMWYKNVYNDKKGFTDVHTFGQIKSGSQYQYPGVYMTLINTDLVDKNIRRNTDDDVFLIFCISLLDRGDFHYNSSDNSGHFVQNTTSFDIMELNKSIKKEITINNEVVFHNSVSLKYLKQIWILPKNENKEKIESLINDNKLKIKVITTEKYLDDIGTNKREPNSCYLYGKPDDNDKWYDVIAKKCNFKNIKSMKDNFEQKIFKDSSNDDIKKYLKNFDVSIDFSEKQIDEIKNMTVQELYFLKYYSKYHDKMDGRKSIRKKSRSKKTKSKKQRKRSSPKKRRKRSSPKRN
jgi:ankyrin repeat protein